MTVTEKVKCVMPTQEGISQKSGDKWYSRDLVLITDERYPKEMAFTFKGGNVFLLDAVAPGDIVSVTFEIESRESNGRYFTTLNAWKLGIQTKATPTPAQAAPAQANPSGNQQSETF